MRYISDISVSKDAVTLCQWLSGSEPTLIRRSALVQPKEMTPRSKLLLDKVVWGQEYRSLKKWSDHMPIKNVTVTNSGKISQQVFIIKNISIYISSYKIKFQSFFNFLELWKWDMRMKIIRSDRRRCCKLSMERERIPTQLFSDRLVSLSVGKLS